MELSRGDALSALEAAGVVSTAGDASVMTNGAGAATARVASRTVDEAPGAVANARPAEAVPTETVVALAEVLYPSVVQGAAEFVEVYVSGRTAADDAFRAAIVDGCETLDSWARAAFDEPFVCLPIDDREELLEDMGVRVVDSVPDGSAIERLNYHLVDELLFALYASPAGRVLVGEENAHAAERSDRRRLESRG